MAGEALGKLLSSFKELEKTVKEARKTLESKGHNSPKLLQHISSYEETLIKQKTLTAMLLGYASEKNWKEVGRHLKIIGGLSATMRDDAAAILLAKKTMDLDTTGTKRIAC